MARPPVPLRVAIVNDYDLVVRGLTDVLSSSSTDAVLLEPADLDRADVVLIDTFGTVDGWEQTRVLLEEGRPVVVFSWEAPTAAYLDYIEDGLLGYISKNTDANTLVTLLRRIASGRSMHPPHLVVDQSIGTWPGRLDGFTAREAEVLAFLAQGLGNDEIARTMFLSTSTVKLHLRTAFRKMGVSTRAQAVLWCLDHGLDHRAHLG